jgi:pimeloyl-ACP methyl ester carboxylesterase
LISEAVSIARDEGLTSYVLWGAFMAAALAAQRHDVATAAVLVAAADRHADRLGTAEPISRACRQIAQAAIDAFATDVTAVRHDGELMTIEDLISRTLDSVA